MEKDELFQKIKLAIDNEYEAYRLYSEMAEMSVDPSLALIFKKIAEEEYEHWQTLQKRYKLLHQMADD